MSAPTGCYSSRVWDGRIRAAAGVLQQLGYEEEARIRGFYAAGGDKIILRKNLTAPGFNSQDDS